MQKEIVQELLNLEEKQKEYLSMLQKGQCIVRVNSIEKPFLLKTPIIERSWLTNEEILENNRKIIEKKSSESKTYCAFCKKEIDSNSDYCINCSTNLKEDDKSFENLEMYINELYEEQQEKKKNYSLENLNRYFLCLHLYGFYNIGSSKNYEKYSNNRNNQKNT